jgi:hypothetical protein
MTSRIVGQLVGLVIMTSLDAERSANRLRRTMADRRKSQLKSIDFFHDIELTMVFRLEIITPI